MGKKLISSLLKEQRLLKQGDRMLTSFIVTKKAMRPASEKERCFHCHQPIGSTHRRMQQSLVNHVYC